MDGGLVVDNEGLHGMVEKCSSRDLSAGPHVLYVTGFQAGGGVGMIAKYSGPDTGNDRILIKSGYAPKNSLYFGQCDPTAQAESTSFTLCMFRSDVGLGSIPRIGQADSGNSRLHFIGKGRLEVVNLNSLEQFRSAVPGVPGADYAWAIYGQLKIGTAGSYKLCITSDDGYEESLDGDLRLFARADTLSSQVEAVRGRAAAGGQRGAAWYG